MKRYGGELIHSSRDPDGILEVIDSHGVRSLHFGTSPRQSAMSLTDPDRLELAYVRAMLSPLLFIDEPGKILLLGLGGGSLAKFMLAHYPNCRIDAVERRAGVPPVAQAFFGLPRDSRLNVHIADGCAHIETLARTSQAEYDLMLVDAYDHLGMDQSINGDEFFRDCARLLRPVGALSMNLWGTHSASLRQSTELLHTCFPGRSYKLAVPNKGNVIGLGLGKDIERPEKGVLLPKAKALEIRLGLEMPYFLRNLRPL